MEYPGFKVCVRCFTFNHSKYITDALNGFVMQQTDFPFVCCIVDDASTDGEQDVIRKYVEVNFDLSDGSCHFERETDYAFITYAQHKTNKNCYFAVLYLKENHYSIKKPKMPYLAEWLDSCIYEALCEGDDWWICEDKLQKQYNALESHPEVDMCCCGTICYKEGKEVDRFQPAKKKCILETEDVIKGGGAYVGTNSIFQRVYLTLNPMRFCRTYSLDYFVQVQGAIRGGIYYIDEFLSAYRVASIGSWSQTMAANKDKQIHHALKVLYCYDLLDEDTSYKYHKIIWECQLLSIIKMFYIGTFLPVFGKKIRQLSFKTKGRIFYNIIKSYFN